MDDFSGISNRSPGDRTATSPNFVIPAQAGMTSVRVTGYPLTLCELGYSSGFFQKRSAS